MVEFRACFTPPIYERNIMSLFGKLVISLIVAAIASAITAYAGPHGAYITLFAAFATATVVTTLVTT